MCKAWLPGQKLHPGATTLAGVNRVSEQDETGEPKPARLVPAVHATSLMRPLSIVAQAIAYADLQPAASA
jgi:hypothetical protein